MDERQVLRGGETPFESNRSIDDQLIDLLDAACKNDVVSFTLYAASSNQPLMQVANIATAGGPSVGFWTYDYLGRAGSGAYLQSLGTEKFQDIVLGEFARNWARSKEGSLVFRSLALSGRTL